MTFKDYIKYGRHMYECTPADDEHKREYIIIARYRVPGWMTQEYENGFPGTPSPSMREYITQRVTYPWAVIRVPAHRWGKYEGLPKWGRMLEAEHFTTEKKCSDFLENGIHAGTLYDFYNVQEVEFFDPYTAEVVHHD